MPYNPGSAYPKKTVYVPHSHPNGLGIVNPVNVTSPLMAPGAARVAAARSSYPLMDARAAAATQTAHSASPSAARAFSRRGIVDDVVARQREAAGLKQNQKGQKQPSNFSKLSDRPANALPVAPGTRVQVGNPVAVANRQGAQQSMDAVVDKVLQSPSMGAPGTPNLVIPKWEGKKK